MDETGAGFAEALAEATALGYAEADPTADVDGFDAAAKAAILAGLAFHTRVTAADVYREGIAGVTAADVASAARDGLHGQAAGHLRADHRPDGTESRRRPGAPGDDPATHPLAGVGDAYNAVFVEAEAAGQLMFYGPGAGGAPTASAVLGDLVAVARNRLTAAAAQASRVRRPAGPADGRDRDALPRQPRRRRRAGRARRRRARLRRARRRSRPSGRTGRGDAATLVLVTHRAPDAALSATVEALRRHARRPGGRQRDARRRD